MRIAETLLTIPALICVLSISVPSVGFAQDARPVAGFHEGFFVQSIDGKTAWRSALSPGRMPACRLTNISIGIQPPW